MPLSIKRLDKPFDPDRLRIGLINDAGDIVVLRAKSKDNAQQLIISLRHKLEHFEISYKGGK